MLGRVSWFEISGMGLGGLEVVFSARMGRFRTRWKWAVKSGSDTLIMQLLACRGQPEDTGSEVVGREVLPPVVSSNNEAPPEGVVPGREEGVVPQETGVDTPHDSVMPSVGPVVPTVLKWSRFQPVNQLLPCPPLQNHNSDPYLPTTRAPPS